MSDNHSEISGRGRSTNKNEQKELSGIHKHVPTLVGGGTFVALALITLLMYMAGN